MEKTIIRIFAKTVNPLIRIAFTDTGCEWVNDTHKINIDTTEDGTEFNKNLIADHKFDGQTINDHIWKVLHEIGHYYTMADCDEEQDEEDRLLLEKLFDQKLISEADWFHFYYNLEAEYIATEWAINYIKTHRKKIDFFNKLLERVI